MPSDVQLREYVEQILARDIARIEVELRSIRASVDVAFAASNKAVDKAEAALTRRLEGMNELREQLREQAETFAREDIVEPRLKRMESFQAKIVGGLLVVPLVSAILAGLVVYVVTH
jgi:hypothetical protein